MGSQVTQIDEVESNDPIADSEDSQPKRSTSKAIVNAPGTLRGKQTPAVQYVGCIVINSESESEEEQPIQHR